MIEPNTGGFLKQRDNGQSSRPDSRASQSASVPGGRYESSSLFFGFKSGAEDTAHSWVARADTLRSTLVETAAGLPIGKRRKSLEQSVERMSLIVCSRSRPEPLASVRSRTEHRNLFNPMLRLYELVQRISVCINYIMGAVG